MPRDKDKMPQSTTKCFNFAYLGHIIVILPSKVLNVAYFKLQNDNLIVLYAIDKKTTLILLKIMVS